MRFRYILILLPLLCCLSCKKADSESQAVVVTNPFVTPRRQSFITFKATLEKYATKATLDLSGTGKVCWEKGDRVLICGEGKEAVYEAISGGKDTSTLVRVSGDTLSRDNGSIFTAYYPADSRDGGVPSRLNYDNPAILPAVPMMASGNKNLNFENRLGVVQCYYKPESDMLVKYLRFSAGSSLSADKTILLDCTGFSPLGINLYTETESSFTIFLQEGSYPSFRVELLQEKDASPLEDITLEYDLEVGKNRIAEVNLNSPSGSSINLSRKGTANCYVISEAGDYFFIPTKGCSQDAITGIASVEVVWEMDNQSTAPTSSLFTSLRYASGKIHFQTPETFKSGNALIAAKDADGTILWSWHIWAIQNAITDLAYDSDKKYLLMDRSLGALAGVRSSNPNSDNKYASSLLYQWGRKDPFPGQTLSGDRPIVAVSGTAMISESAPVTMEQATQHPTVFYLGTGNWCSADASRSPSTKSIYDPCPAGYIVPPQLAFSESADVFYDNYTGSNCKSRGGSFIFALSGKYYCYPLSAWFNGSTGAKEAKGTNMMWTTQSQSDAATACYMWYGTPEGSSAKAPLVDASYQLSKTSGASVRCMKIQEQ